MTVTTAQIRKIAEIYFGVELGNDLVAALKTTAVAGGDWLFHEGDDGSTLYLLVHGRLQVWTETSDRQPLRLLGEVTAGESVGEIGLLTGEKRSAGVRAIRDSLLISIDREAFERLAVSHPSLVMQLAANVATLLRSQASRGARASWRLNTIALVPLTDNDRTRVFCNDVAAGLAASARTLELTEDNLAGLGAPLTSVGGGETIPEALQTWLHDQETRTDYVLYRCRAVDDAWSRFALRQSDLIVYVADARGDPQPAAWESRLLASKGAVTGKQALVLLQPGSSRPVSDTDRWLQPRRADFHLHARADVAGDTARVVRIISGSAVGLVLGAGGARGFAHIGVYRALLEAGVPIDWVGGTSIGAIFAAAIAAGWSYEETVRIARHSFVAVKPFSDYTLPLVALLRGRRMERELRASQDYRIEDLPIPFFCISSVLDNGRMQVHEHGDLPAALRASAALPGVIPPAVVEKRLTIDGSVLNSLPVDIMRQKPVGRVIAVDLSASKTYEVEYASVPSPWSILSSRYLPFRKRIRAPSITTTMLKATEIGTQEKVRQARTHADLLLQPPVRKFGITNVKAFDRIIDAGYVHACKKLKEWPSR